MLRVNVLTVIRKKDVMNRKKKVKKKYDHKKLSSYGIIN